MSGYVVELRDVFCVHRTNEGDAAALQGINLELANGELLCVLGPSGAGKSTLLRVIAGLQPPSAGAVRVLEWDIGRLPERARARIRHERMGFLAQHSEDALPPDLRARQAVELPLALRGMAKRERRARAQELIAAAGLDERADARPGELSGGERQRFALCAALAPRPALLFADEPTGELDEAAAHSIRRLIAELARSAGTSVIVVSHDEETATIARRTVRIRDGRVVEERRESEPALVVNRGGWLQLPAELLNQAQIRRRAHARRGPDGLVVTPAAVGNEPEPATAASIIAPQRANPAAVSLRSVSMAYGHGRVTRAVLDQFTHDFEPGRMTVVTGRSGTGKTTLLRLIAALSRPDAGELTVDGRSLTDCGAEELATLRRRRTGYLAQEPSVVGFLSAIENVELTLRIRGADSSAARERAAAAVQAVGLGHRATQRAERLSAGEEQRLALARALAGARGLLIVDEPTSRLDEANAAMIARLLGAAAAKETQTVICASHDPEILRVADQVLTLPAGQADLPRFVR